MHARWACPKFLKQTFQEWAQHSMTRCAWARKHYDSQRARKGNQAGVRSLAFNGFAFSSDAGRLGRPMTRPRTPNAWVDDRPCRTPMCKSGGKMWRAFRNRKPSQLDFETQMSPMVFGIIPECRSAFLRNWRQLRRNPQSQVGGLECRVGISCYCVTELPSNSPAESECNPFHRLCCAP